jgi:hypothetical protein
MPGKEPKQYYDSLAKLEPVINFREEDLQTEDDWFKGRRIDL